MSLILKEIIDTEDAYSKIIEEAEIKAQKNIEEAIAVSEEKIGKLEDNYRKELAQVKETEINRAISEREKLIEDKLISLKESIGNIDKKKQIIKKYLLSRIYVDIGSGNGKL